MKKNKHTSIKNIHKRIFTVQLVLILTLALFLGISGTLVNLQFEIQKRDQNLQNIAEAIAQSPILLERKSDSIIQNEYLDSPERFSQMYFSENIGKKKVEKASCADVKKAFLGLGGPYLLGDEDLLKIAAYA